MKLYGLYLGEEPLEAARTLAQDFGIPISENDGTLHVNARHLENALERRRKARMLELSEAYLAADEEIGRILREPVSIEERAQQLVEEANDHGGKDNIAVIIIDAFAKE